MKSRKTSYPPSNSSRAQLSRTNSPRNLLRKNSNSPRRYTDNELEDLYDHYMLFWCMCKNEHPKMKDRTIRKIYYLKYGYNPFN